MSIKLMYLRKITYYIAIICLAAFFQCNNTFAAIKTKPVIVNMYDKYFQPATITISAGQTVVWINKGNIDHTVTSDNGYFDSGHIRPGGKTSYTFTKPGVFSYNCTMHSLLFLGMRGKVIVK